MEGKTRLLKQSTHGLFRYKVIKYNILRVKVSFMDLHLNGLSVCKYIEVKYNYNNPEVYEIISSMEFAWGLLNWSLRVRPDSFRIYEPQT